MERSFSLEEINDVAKTVWEKSGNRRVIAIHGQMGAGKTTFIHALCEVKGVKDVVGSPTFSLVNEYIFKEDGRTGKIFHIDLYRLKDEQEAINAGIEDCLYSDHLCLVEWPEKAPGIFPNDTLHLILEVTGTKTRKLRISNN